MNAELGLTEFVYSEGRVMNAVLRLNESKTMDTKESQCKKVHCTTTLR